MNYFSISSVTPVDENTTTFTLVLNPECEVYEGHFPGNPVSPGVCNIAMIKECAETIMGRPIMLNRIKQCKFTHLVLPTAGPLTLQLTIISNTLTAELRQQDISSLRLKAEFL